MVLSHDVVNPATVPADTDFAAPLTNPLGMIDPTQALQDFLGVKGNIYIITPPPLLCSKTQCYHPLVLFRLTSTTYHYFYHFFFFCCS